MKRVSFWERMPPKYIALAIVALVGFVSLAWTSFSPLALAQQSAQESAAPGAPVIRRLNEEQYIRSVQNVFGFEVDVPGRFDPPVRESGLLAIGDGQAAISSAGFEQYELRARNIAAQVVSEAHRASTVPCAPADATAFDAACADSFVGKYGRLLYRRPLTDAERASTLAVARSAAAQSGNFYGGLERALARMLVSPNFIFRIEEFEADATGAYRLNDYSLATRLSFLMWDAPPDEALLEAAGSGALRTDAGLSAQVDRLIAAPQFTDGVRAFFSDMFGFEQFNVLTKDQSIFPIYTSQLAADAREQMLQTITQHLVTRNADYRDLFTTRTTMMNRNLGGLYNVPISTDSVAGWAPHTFDEGDQRAGILTLAGFLMLDVNHEGRTSPTIRGKSVRELFLCQAVPQPPANVDFALVSDVNNPQFRTARGRLTVHRENPVCAGCHAVTDPIGLSLEHYDAVGRFRTQENETEIDASGTYRNQAFNDVVGLQALIRDDPAASNCVVQRAFEYGVARPKANGDRAALEQLSSRFAEQRYSFPALMRAVALSAAFQSP